MEPRSGKSALLTLKAIMLIIFHLMSSNYALAVYHGHTLIINLLNTQCTATNQYSLYKQHATPATPATSISWLNITALT